MNIFYKYLPPARLSYLDDALLRFTPPAGLNDPYECLPALPEQLAQRGLEHIKKILNEPPPYAIWATRLERHEADRKYRKALARSKNVPRDKEAVAKIFYKASSKRMNEKIGILSLSRRWDSSLMWAHYTASHCGFCVGFNKEHSFFQAPHKLNTEKFAVSPVNYSSARPIVPDGRPNIEEVF